VTEEETAETEEEQEAEEAEEAEKAEEKPKKSKKAKKKSSRERNTIYIGKKPLMSYALAALLQFNAGSDEIIIKARGRAISTAVDVAEVVKRRLYADMVDVKSIDIGTEVLGEEQRNVSTMSIVLEKTK
jgi:DNA-binding protein